jgi:hypothetical protein
MSIYGLPPSLEEVLAGMGVRQQAPAMPPAPPMMGMPEPPPANPTFGLSPEDLAILGPDPAQGPEFEPQTMRVNPIERVLMALGQGVAGTPVPYPRNFGQGLATGFVRGLGGAGMGVAAAQDRFAKREEARRLAFDEQRRVATKEYRDKAWEILKENRKAKKDVSSNERTVTPDDAKMIPSLAPWVGKQIPKTAYDRAVGVAVTPESPAERRAIDAAARAQRDEARKIAAVDRQNRLDRAKGINDLADDYKNDPDIKRFMNIDNNVIQGESAAAQNNGIGDHALIFAYMRALEPTNPNAVREGEFDTASKAVGAIQNVFLKATLRRYMQGDILLPAGREAILEVMRDAREEIRADFDAANKQYRNRAQMFDLNDPQNFFLRERPARPRTPRANAAAVDSAMTPVRQ